MRYKRIPIFFSVFLLVACSLSAFLLPIVHADADYKVYEYINTSNWTGEGTLQNSHPSYVSAHSAIGTLVYTAVDGYLTEVRVYLKRSGTLTSTTYLVGQLEYAYNATYRWTNGTVAAQATNNVTGADIDTVGAYEIFYFNQTFLIKNATYYTFNIYGYGGELDATHYVMWSYGSNVKGSEFASGIWNGQNVEHCITVYANVDVAAAPTPTPSPTATPAPWLSDEMSDIVSFMLPIGLIFAPFIFFFSVSQGRIEISKWVFILCLAIGVSLAYVFFPAYVPVWFVVLLAVAIAGLAYSDIRGN